MVLLPLSLPFWLETRSGGEGQTRLRRHSQNESVPEASEVRRGPDGGERALQGTPPAATTAAGPSCLRAVSKHRRDKWVRVLATCRLPHTPCAGTLLASAAPWAPWAPGGGLADRWAVAAVQVREGRLRPSPQRAALVLQVSQRPGGFAQDSPHSKHRHSSTSPVGAPADVRDVPSRTESPDTA